MNIRHFSILILTLAMMASCTNDTNPLVADKLLDDNAIISTSNVIDDKSVKDANHVTICHFPPGNPQVPKVLTVGAKAAEAHLSNHEGDGIVGEDYNHNCDPISNSELPDLGLGVIEASIRYFDQETGEWKSDLIIHIANGGVSAAGPFDVMMGEETIRLSSGLNAGESKEFVRSITTGSNDSGGIFEFLIHVDTNQEVAETDETNNDALVTIEYFSGDADLPLVTVENLGSGSGDPCNSNSELPDLGLGVIEASIRYFDQETGQWKSDLIIHIANGGVSAAGPFDVMMGEETIRLSSGLNAGESKEFVRSITTGSNDSGGIFEFLIHVDTNQEVAETDETNNDALVTIEYFSGDADLPLVTVENLGGGCQL